MLIGYKILFFCFPFSLCFGFNLQDMSVEEKVGQLLMVHFCGETVNADAVTLVQDTKVGGVIYYNWSNGLHSPEQVRVLSADLQKLTLKNQMQIPLLIAVDQEGGVVSRCKCGFSSFPGNKALAMAGDVNLAEKAAQITGEELLSVGINMNLAPVVDINSNPRNPVIGIRSFGSTPEVVVAFGEKVLHGYAKAHVIATLKHFPGHGDVSVDSHKELPVIYKSKEELERDDLIPFAKLASSADAIMTAHILVPALDSENCATLSKNILNYLKEEIGFRGVIVSDSLVMEGVLKKCHTVDEAAIQALNAGCDLLILGGKFLSSASTGFELTSKDVQRICCSIVCAVKEGRIEEERLNEAVEKILTLKTRFSKKFCGVSAQDGRYVAKQIASLSLREVERDGSLIGDISEKKLFVVAPHVLNRSISETALLHLGKDTDSFFFNSLNILKEEIEDVRQRAEMADVIVVFSFNAWKSSSQMSLIQALLDIGKPTVFVTTGESLDSTLFPKAHLIFNTSSPSTPSIQAVCDRLEQLTSLG